MPGHDVKQQQPAAHHSRLGAGRRAGQGDDHVGRGHQRRHLVGEAERPEQGTGSGQPAELALGARVPAGDREDVHAGVGEGGRRRRQRREAPAAVDQQRAARRLRNAEPAPGRRLARRVVESGPHRRGNQRDRRPGQEPPHRRGRGGRADEEQVGALVHPQLVRGDVRAVDDRAELWCRGPGGRPPARPGRSPRSSAAASAPVAKTLSTRSTGSRSSSARSLGTAGRAARRSASLATRPPVRNWAKCRPS